MVSKFYKKGRFLIAFLLFLVCFQFIYNLSYNKLENKTTNDNVIKESEKISSLNVSSKYKLLANSASASKANIDYINGWRYVQEGFVADGGSVDFPCGTKVWITYCIESILGDVCYYDVQGGSSRAVYRSKLASTLEGAKATCTTSDTAVNADRFVVDKDTNYSCGDKLWISSCDQKGVCKYTNSKGKGTVSRNDLRISSSVAKEECEAMEEIGYRYIAVDGNNFSCSDKLYITKCDDSKCKYTSVNGKNASGTVNRNDLKNKKSAAEEACGVKGYRYIGLDDNVFNCGDEVYITGCTDTFCDYTKINGSSASGTVSRDRLKEAKSAAKDDCEKKSVDFGDRYVAGKGSNYSCGDKLYITTCDEDYCNFSKVNDKKVSGVVDRNVLKTSQNVAKEDCNKETSYGYRYASTSGTNFICGDKLYISECDEDVCIYTSVNGADATGAVPRQSLKVKKSATTSSCTPVDYGSRYPSVNGNNFSCGDELYITTCDETTCNYSKINGVDSSGSVERQKLKLDKSVAISECKNTTEFGKRYVSVNGENYKCGDALYITSCSLDYCNYSKVISEDGTEVKTEGTINRDLLKVEKKFADALCENKKIDDDQKKCDNVKKVGNVGKGAFTYCYNSEISLEDLRKEIQEMYICDEKNGYKLDPTSIVSVGEKSCNDNGLCSSTFELNCTKGEGGKPTVSVTSGFVQGGGVGVINVSAKAKEGTISSYYVSDTYVTPTDSSSGWVDLQSDTFSIESPAGIKYIWVRDSKGNISDALSGAVLDTINVDTTLKTIEIKNSNNESQSVVGVTHDYKGIKPNKYVMLSNDLKKDSKVLASGFNPFDMEYKLNVSSPTVSVYATLTSTDASYVPGYEPRTVNLKYGVNTVLIKIKNNKGVVRTYTILVTRTDDRTSDNTLNELTVSEGNINFNANVTDYKVEISNSTKSVNVNGVISSDKASFVPGYEPGEVKITGDTTVKLIKVKSETGSTRTYVITFVKGKSDVITNESLQLQDFVIPGVFFPFEESVANYSISVEYEKESINLNAVLKDDTSSYVFRAKKKSSTEYKTISSTGVGLDVGENFIEVEVTNVKGEKSFYRITIIRKEFGLGISNDTSLKDLKVLGYDIKFSPTEKNYVVKIKREKSLVITAVPNSNRAEVFIRGNDELTGFSTVRIKVVAENGKFETYSIDIKKDVVNKAIEFGAIGASIVVIIIGSFVIIKNKKRKANKAYLEE